MICRTDFSFQRYLLLALALGASFIEVAPLASLVREGSGLVPVLLGGLAYQIGNALARARLAASNAALLFLAACGVLSMSFAGVGQPVWFVGLTALSWSFQIARQRLQAESTGQGQLSAGKKRTARVLGFGLATILPAVIWVPTISILMLVALAQPTVFPKRPLVKIGLNRLRPIEVVMILHQIHYFLCCYALFFLFTGLSLGGPALAGTWFACGWATYTAAESLWHKLSPARTFVVAHLALAGLLLTMALVTDQPYLLAILWTVSGFASGTAYCLGKIEPNNSIAQQRMEIVEDVGHLSGTSMSVGVAALLTAHPAQLLLLGAGAALLAALTMCLNVETVIQGSANHERQGQAK